MMNLPCPRLSGASHHRKWCFGFYFPIFVVYCNEITECWLFFIISFSWFGLVGQVLPMNPDLPADLFTACLTTPIEVAFRWCVVG
jgi:hypothetical protein